MDSTTPEPRSSTNPFSSEATSRGKFLEGFKTWQGDLSLRLKKGKRIHDMFYVIVLKV